jgi:hypothetical protein
MSEFIPPAAIGKTAGTWTPAIANNLPNEARGAADGVFTLLVPVTVPSSANYHNGARLKSIDLYYAISVGACDDVASFSLDKITLPANASAPTGAAVTATADSANDTGAKRKTAAAHTLTITVTTPEWVDNDTAYVLSLVVDAAANSVFTLYGARANFDLRID